MPDLATRPSTALLLLCALACASCLTGGNGRVLYRHPRPAIVPVEPASTLALPKSAGAPAEHTLVPPLSLTAADGTALTLGRVGVRGFVDGPLALTELHLDFVHAEARTIEGRFEITLPPGAEISRFAMRVGDSWQEAEVVERQRARAVYETILHQGLDPALLEHEAGNRFSARVFPIGPNERKQLIVSYTHELDGGGGTYAIPLRGLPKVPELAVEVGSAQAGVVFERVFERHLAQEDLIVTVPSTRGLAFADRELAVARIVPVTSEASSANVEPLESVTILFDTSASRAANFGEKLHRFESFCAALHAQIPSDPKLVLVAFDQTSEVIYRGPLSGLGKQHFDRIADRRALGATDLSGALSRLRKGESERLLLATDGVATAGQVVDADALAGEIANAGFERVDVLIDGSVRDQALLERLVASFSGQIIELERTKPNVAASRVRRPSLGPIDIEVEGASWVSPREVRGLQPGDDVLVFARFDAPARALRVTTRERDGEARAQHLELTVMARPLLERAMVSRRVRELATQLQDRAAAEPEWALLTRRELVELSTKHRVLTPYTAMLVLENDASYARFDLHRDAMAPILTVSDHGLVVQRARDPLPPEEDSLLVTKFKSESEDPPTLEDGPLSEWSSADDEASEEIAGDVLQPEGANIREEENPLESDGHQAEAMRQAPKAKKVNKKARRARPKPVARVEVRRSITSDAFELEPVELTRIDHAVRRCYDHSLAHDGSWDGRAEIHLSVRGSGEVDELRIDGASGHPSFDQCLRAHAWEWHFVASGRAGWLLRSYVFVPGVPTSSWSPPSVLRSPTPVPSPQPPVEGRYAEVLDLLAADRRAEALELALVWHELFPGDPLALLALGKALLAANRLEEAARAYGGIIDLHPSRADILRFAGNLLESLPEPPLPLVIDCYERAVAARPDQPSGYRMLAMAHARSDALDDAFTTLEHALELQLPSDRYLRVQQLMLVDLQMIAGAWAAREPKRRAEVLRRIVAVGGRLDVLPSLRFVLTWETDANDVDLHVRDAHGQHADYENRALPDGGGQLLADVTTGFGPEGFVVHEPKMFPYLLSVVYYNRGVSGHGIGQVQIVHHDGAGNLRFESRPFVVMSERHEFALGVVNVPSVGDPADTIGGLGL
jgi:hypothetical protein